MNRRRGSIQTLHQSRIFLTANPDLIYGLDRLLFNEFRSRRQELTDQSGWKIIPLLTVSNFPVKRRFDIMTIQDDPAIKPTGNIDVTVKKRSFDNDNFRFEANQKLLNLASRSIRIVSVGRMPHGIKRPRPRCHDFSCARDEWWFCWVTPEFHVRRYGNPGPWLTCA